MIHCAVLVVCRNGLIEIERNNWSSTGGQSICDIHYLHKALVRTSVVDVNSSPNICVSLCVYLAPHGQPVLGCLGTRSDAFMHLGTRTPSPPPLLLSAVVVARVAVVCTKLPIVQLGQTNVQIMSLCRCTYRMRNCCRSLFGCGTTKTLCFSLPYKIYNSLV